MLDKNEVIKRQKAYLERIKKGEEKITGREIEEAIYSEDSVTWCDLDEYRFQIFIIALEKGYCRSDEIYFPFILTRSRNLYIRKYAIESILDDNLYKPKPEFLINKLSYMEGDKDVEELSAHWDRYKLERTKYVDSALTALNGFYYKNNKPTLPPECWEMIFKNLAMQDLKNICSLFFKTVPVANELSKTSETPLPKP